MPARPITIDTGRDRTLRYSGGILCPYLNDWRIITDPEDGLEKLTSVRSRYGEVRIEGPWYILDFEYVETVLTDPLPPFIPPPASPIDVRVTRRARARIVSPDRLTTYDDSGWVTAQEDYQWPGSLEYDGEGSWEAECPVYERLTSDAMDGTLIDADGFPLRPVMAVPEDSRIDYYDTAQADGLQGIEGRYFESMAPLGDLTATITVQGVTASASWSLFGGQYDFNLPLYATKITAQAFAVNATCVTSVEADFCGQEKCAAPGITWDNGDRSASFENGVVARSTIALGTIVEASLWPPCRADFEWKAYNFERTFPISPTWRWQQKRKGDGDFHVPKVTATSSQVRQDRYEILIYDVTPTIHFVQALDAYAPHRVWLDDDWLTESQDDNRDWRTMIRGKLVEVESTAWNQAVRIDEGDPANWTAGSNTTKGGATSTTLATSGGTGSGSRTWSPEAILEPYRYMALRIRSVVNGSVPLTIGMHGETWDIETGAANTFSEVIVDLCCSTSETDDVEPKDSRFPIDGPADPTAELTQDPYKLGWGVDWVDTLTISGIPDGETIEVDWIEVRQEIEEDVYFGFLCPFKKRSTGWVSPSDTTYLMPYWYVTVDGRISDIGVHGAFVDVNSGTDYYSWYSVDDIITWLGYLPGYIGSAETFTDDGYHNRDLEALHLCGNGITVRFNQSSGAITRTSWQNWAKEVADQTIPVQALWDQLDAYPGIGRGCFTGEDYATNQTSIPIRAGVHLRGRWEGLIFDEDAKAYAAVLAFTDPDGGSDATDSFGRYETALTGGLGGDSYDLEALAKIQTDTQANRWRNRTGFRVPRETSDGSVSYDVDDSMMHLLARISSGDVVVDQLDNRVGVIGSYPTGVAAQAVCIRWSRETGKVFLWTAESGTVYRRSSTDGGRTFGMATSIGAGSQIAGVAGRGGLTYEYRVNGTSVVGRIIDRNGSLVGSEFTAISGVDSGSAIAADESTIQGGEWRMTIWVSVGGNLTRYTSSDGRTFA